MRWESYLVLLWAFDFEVVVGFVDEDDDWLVEPLADVE